MTTVKTTEIEEGMVLAHEVKGPNGKLLLAKDTVLNAKHIRILKTWGINEITIPGGPEENEETFSQEELDSAAEVFEEKIVAKRKEAPFFEYVRPFAIKSIARHRRNQE